MGSATDRSHIEELLAEFAWRIDFDGGRGVEDLFTEDGTYNLFGHQVTGRGAIMALYEHRRSLGERTSRHLFTNLHLDVEEADDTRVGSCVLTLHAADGPPPHPLSPLLVADFFDTYHRDFNGRWRFRSRTAAPVFLRDAAGPVRSPSD